MTHRSPGMDHPHYAYEALPARAPIVWPDGARLAWSVFLYLEYWEVDPPKDAVTDPRMKDSVAPFYPDYRTSTRMEYGNRVGIFRLFEIFDRYGLKVTVPVNVMALERYPFLVGECLKRGYELAAHGVSASRMLSSKMSEAEEADVIGSCIEAIERTSGQRPTGWVGQDYGQSARTPKLLADAGLAYLCDWPNDDAPYLMTHLNARTGRPLISLPNQAEWDDVQLLWHRKTMTQRFPEIVGEAFDVLHAEGSRFFGLHIHPWLFGMPYRTRYLEATLARLSQHRNVWQTTSGDVARHVSGAIGKAKPERPPA
jgi:allantoinase